MRKLILFLIAGLTMLACQSNKSGSRQVTAEFQNVKDGTEVYLYKLKPDAQKASKETFVIQNGRVSFDLPKVSSPTLNMLSIAGTPKGSELFFINENLPIQLKYNREDTHSYRITGSFDNTLLREYSEFMAKNDAEVQKTLEKYPQEEWETPRVKNQVRIKEKQMSNENMDYRRQLVADPQNRDNPASMIFLSDILRTGILSGSELKSIYDKLNPKLRDNELTAMMSSEFNKVVVDPLAIGNKAPSFSAKTPEGEDFSLEQSLAKYTLVDFWAAWCGPCRRENPNLVKVYNKYHDKGFNILGVSLDRTHDRWIKAIEQDGLVWDQISNLQFWNDPIAKQYRVKSIPASFLLDSEGRIVAKDLRGPMLERKISELLGE